MVPAFGLLFWHTVLKSVATNLLYMRVHQHLQNFVWILQNIFLVLLSYICTVMPCYV